MSTQGPFNLGWPIRVNFALNWSFCVFLLYVDMSLPIEGGVGGVDFNGCLPPPAVLSSTTIIAVRSSLILYLLAVINMELLPIIFIHYPANRY